MTQTSKNADGLQNTFDPYLTWAELTEYAGFAANSNPVAKNRDDSLFLVAVERLDKAITNPFPVSQASTFPVVGLRPSRAMPNVFIGNAGSKDKVRELAALSGHRTEFNMVRYRKDDSAASGVVKYALQPKLKNKVIAIIDYGCPFAHRQFLDFKKNHLASKVKYLWDQDAGHTVDVRADDSLEGIHWFPVDIFSYGRETTEPVISRLLSSCINEAGELDEDRVYEKSGYQTVDFPSSHGGCVMDLAAGQMNPRSGLEDAASEADIIFVQLPKSMVKDTTGGAMSVYILDALDYILSKCDSNPEIDQLVINLSYGATAGPHNGQTLIERAMDSFLDEARKKAPFRKIDIVLAAGNHHEANLHLRMKFDNNNKSQTLKWQVMPDDPTDSFVELWCDQEHCASFTVSLTSPSGKKIENVPFGGLGCYEAAGKTLASVIRPNDFTGNKEKHVALIALAPTHELAWGQAEQGVWSVTITKKGNASFDIDAWIERDDPMSWERGQPQSHFVSTSPHMTATELDVATEKELAELSLCYFGTNSKISNGKHTIVVGSYIAESLTLRDTGEAKDFELAPYSGAASEQFPDGSERTVWPDYVAPTDQSRAVSGIVVSGNRTGSWVRVSGTSFAAPQITRHLINLGTSGAIGMLKPGLDKKTTLSERRGKSAPRLI